MPDAVALLKQDHRSVEKLFDRFEKSGDAEIVRRICQELRAHTALEEELVYPLLADQVDRTLARQAKEDHRRSKQLVERIERWRVADGGLRDLVAELKKVVLEHVEEEEGELFPTMERQIPSKLAGLGEALAERRQDNVSDLESSMAKLKGGVNKLARQGRRAILEELESMTKAELEAYALESEISDVDASRQTKDEMIQTIREDIAG